MTTAADKELKATPLCGLHRRLEDRGQLTVVYGNNCVACSLNEREELLTILDGGVPADGRSCSVGELRKLIASYDYLREVNRELVEALKALYSHQQSISSPDTRWELPIYQKAREIMLRARDTREE